MCFVTPAHLAANPRLVKEADALAEAGYPVTVISCRYMEWAGRADEPLLARARWRARVLSWRRDERPALFWKSRLRQHACRYAVKLLPGLVGRRAAESVVLRAMERVFPELLREALRVDARLYIAHNPGALPVAVAAARARGAKVGFDAEDYSAGIRRGGEADDITHRLVTEVETRYVARCDYVTAASPGIGAAYADQCGIAAPTPVLNVFPLRYRPPSLRPAPREGPLRLYWFSQTIGAHRGLEDAIRAMGMLSSRPCELHLRGVWQHGYRERLYRLAGEVGVDPNRVVARGWAPPDDMVRLSAEHEVGLALEQSASANRDLCLTNKLFVYLLAGNAIVATATRAQRELLDKLDGAGACYEPGDAAGLAACLRRWWDDREALEKARRRAWQWGGSRYNWDSERRKFLAVVERTLQGAPSGAR